MKSNLLYIGNKLSKHGLTVTSIETLGALLDKEGYNLIYASSKKYKMPRLLDMLYATVRHRKQIDYVLIDTYSTKNFWYAFFVSQLCRVLGLKYITKLEGGDLPNRISKSPTLSKMIFKYSYKNIAPSSYLLEAFKNKGYSEICYIPNIIELQHYPFKAREIVTPKLLWVRSFSSIYNPKMAINVFKELNKEFPDAELCMVGPDKDGALEEIRILAKKYNLEVKFTGKLSKHEWITLSKDYNIFINTTHFDNTPVSVIEAMALGMPVVSTNVGGISYLLEDRKTALLVNDNDTKAMVSCIKEITNDKKISESLIHNAFTSVQDFDWTKVKNKWNEVLK
ncbi:glycosyltransferase family 4 protein [Flavobacterium sp.]|uniref:glycosyltransferase family 4 protein n=1 Tax=Flavobacterium sp. TaxID=239 RepID=UPI00286CCCE1|nr:glycosyltransferase family 4 protein [Flavobacterium sp.]